MSATLTAELWPLDFEGIEKGDVVTVERIEQIASLNAGHRVTRGTDEYNLATMQIQTAIQLQRPELRTRRDHHNIRVLTDDEYAEHTTQRTRAALAKLHRTVALPPPEMESLTAEQRATYESAQSRALRHQQAIVEKEREFRAELRRIEAAKLGPKT